MEDAQKRRVHAVTGGFGPYRSTRNCQRRGTTCSAITLKRYIWYTRWAVRETKLLEGEPDWGVKVGDISDSGSTKAFIRHTPADEDQESSGRLISSEPFRCNASIPDTHSQCPKPALGWVLAVLQYPLFSTAIQSLGGIFFFFSLVLYPRRGRGPGNEVPTSAAIFAGEEAGPRGATHTLRQ